LILLETQEELELGIPKGAINLDALMFGMHSEKSMASSQIVFM
jgi:hypothetical protein